MIQCGTPALVLAPMDGITDAPMRALQGACGAFDLAVSEFLRVNQDPIPGKVFQREVPELLQGGRTASGLPVQVQLLGGHPERMAASARVAVENGALAVDINFGCPAPTVNRHDGGASLLRCPHRMRDIVSAVRQAVPTHIPVSAKLRLGWDNLDDIHLNADMAAEGGADWLTIHARTRAQGYEPPVYWKPIGQVRRRLNIPVIANGDIWTLEAFRRCQEETECQHFMLGRCALADPNLATALRAELGLVTAPWSWSWPGLLGKLAQLSPAGATSGHCKTLTRLKQWVRIASRYGTFAYFDQLKRCATLEEFFRTLESCFQDSFCLQT